MFLTQNSSGLLITWTGLSSVKMYGIMKGFKKNQKVRQQTIVRGKISDVFVILTENDFMLYGRQRRLLNTSECSSE